jgi:hypothetical protein
LALLKQVLVELLKNAPEIEFEVMHPLVLLG